METLELLAEKCRQEGKCRFCEEIWMYNFAYKPARVLQIRRRNF